MGVAQRIYDHVPIFMQNVMCTLSGYQKCHHRYGKAYWDYRRFLEEFDGWPLEKQLDYQREQLQRFLHFAVEHSPFYAKLYREIQLDSIQNVADLKKLPVVDKETLRKNMDAIVTAKGAGTVESHTGGTTGKSLTVVFTERDYMERMAMLDHFKARVGFEHRKMKRATFNGKHIVPPGQKRNVFWRYNASCKQMIYSSFHLSEKNLAAYVESLNAFQPDALDGFFTSMCDVASYIERRGLKITFQPVAIFPTSETLTQTGRELLGRVFHCKVYDQYASSEGAPFVTECPCQHLHMELATGVIEHLTEDDTEVLVTSFTTHGTPLIRYRIGDRMRFGGAGTECGCNLVSPLVEEIQGRRLDFLYTPEGAKINAGNVANILKNLPNVIVRAQFCQERMDALTVLLEVDHARYQPTHEALLRQEIMHKFGKNMAVEISVVDEIPREKSGKFRMIQNTVN